MKAITINQYGSPDVLELTEIDKPIPKADEVLIKVHAAAANPLDWHLMRGEPFIARLDNGLLKPNFNHMGADVAGTVEAIGERVTRFKPGDAVFGDIASAGLGAFGEYVCATEGLLALKPVNATFAEAAAVPVAAYTALQGLRDKGRIHAGQRVLINGASGGVGTFAIQIAKAFDAEVTGVCSTRNVEMVYSIGADHVVDYTQTDFTRTGEQYDLIFDAVGNRSVRDMRRVLKATGIVSIAGFTTLPRLFGHVALGALASATSDQEIGLMAVARSDLDDLHFLKELIEAGQIKPVIDRCYPLEETADAIRYLETSRARGKVIIQIT